MPSFRRNNTNNATIGDQINQKLTFFGMVGMVMAALKLKERWDEYKQLPSDEEGGIRLPNSPVPGDDDDVSMLDTQIPGTARTKRPKRKGCCVCCGLDCGLFWKAIGIVMLLFTLWNGFKLIKWAITPSPTGLEAMPKYSSSLGCSSAPYIYGGAKASYTIPVGSSKPNHALTIRGAAVGTLVIAEASADASDITLEMTLRTDDQSLLNSVKMDIPDSNLPGLFTQAALTTPLLIDPRKSCMRYDITLYVPSTLKTLQLSTYSVTQIQFHQDAHITLDNLLVMMYGMDENNMLLPSAGIRATNMDVSSYRGWIVGDMAIVNSTAITTENGDCVANVHVHPAPPINHQHPEPAYLTTTHGNGRADFFYENDHAYPHRPIVNSHNSARKGDLYLTYKDAEYSGSIDLKAQSYTARGMQGSAVSHPGQGDNAKGLPWAGNKDGGDKLVIRSPKGWVGLYF